MAALQICVDFLLSAGGTYVGSEKELRTFQIDENGVLTYRSRVGNTLGPLNKVTDGVKQNSSATYLPNKSKSELIICVSSSSTLRVLEFDEDEDEWTDSPSFTPSAVSSSGQIAAATDVQGNPLVFYQDTAGKLIVTRGSSSIQPLPIDPITSTPISAAVALDGTIILFYIAQDNFVHYLTYKGDSWVDTILAEVSFKTLPKRTVGYITETGVYNVFAISDNSALVLISQAGKTIFGKVLPDGKFVPGTTEEAGDNITIAIDICVCM